ncbi:hypothetical protein ACHAP5_001127 [Fusarium lateritium]
MAWSELVDEIWSSPMESQATLTVGDGTSPIPDFDSFRFQTRLVPSTDVSREILSVIVFQVGSKSGRTSANTCLGEFTLQGPTLSFRDYATMVAVSPFESGKQLASTEFGMVAASSSDAVVQKTMAGYASDPAGTDSGTIESSSSMPNGKYPGLVADVEVSRGLCPEPWLTLPEAYTTAPSQDATAREAEEAAHAGSTMPLYNILGEDFREALSADSGAGGVFTVMDGTTIEEGLPQLSNGSSSTRTQVGFGAAFGKFLGLAQCREDAMSHSIHNWEAGFHVVALLVERFMSLQQYDLALQYARLVFDPTGSNNPPLPKDKDKDSSSANASASASTWRPTWRFPPFDIRPRLSTAPSMPSWTLSGPPPDRTKRWRRTCWTAPSVAFSLYCVAGPYTNVSCNATLVDHRYRYDPGCTGGYGEKSSPSKPDPRFLSQTAKLPVSSVALSIGQLDAGVFELNFTGEEYQPFEGAGAISTWELRLPKTYTQFDYKTISDAIIHLRYTAKSKLSALLR